MNVFAIWPHCTTGQLDPDAAAKLREDPEPAQGVGQAAAGMQAMLELPGTAGRAGFGACPEICVVF